MFDLDLDETDPVMPPPRPTPTPWPGGDAPMTAAEVDEPGPAPTTRRCDVD